MITNINNVTYKKYIKHINEETLDEEIEDDSIIGENIFSDIDLSSTSLLNMRHHNYSHQLDDNFVEKKTQDIKKIKFALINYA